MKEENQKNFCIAVCMLIAFVLWTVAIRFIDVQAIGPQESSVGFATINDFIHNLTGVHWFTDIIGAVLLSTGLVLMHRYISNLEPKQC